MATLVWAVESVLMGLWALVLSAIFSTPFHRFMAISHLLISSLTAVVALLIVSRNPARAFPVAQAFNCAVTALVLVYVAVLLHPPSYAAAFNSPDVGILPLAGCVGLAWALASLLSATGMALGDSTQKSTLFLHPFGYHLPAVLPCVFITLRSGVVWLSVIEFIIWLAFAGGHLFSAYIPTDVTTEEQIPRKFTARIREFFTCEGLTPRQIGFRVMKLTLRIIKFVARVACVLVPVLMWLACDKTADVNVLALTTIIIAGMNFLSWASVLDWLLGTYTITQSTAPFTQPVIDSVIINTPLRWRDKFI